MKKFTEWLEETHPEFDQLDEGVMELLNNAATKLGVSADWIKDVAKRYMLPVAVVVPILFQGCQSKQCPTPQAQTKIQQELKQQKNVVSNPSSLTALTGEEKAKIAQMQQGIYKDVQVLHSVGLVQIVGQPSGRNLMATRKRAEMNAESRATKKHGADLGGGRFTCKMYGCQTVTSQQVNIGGKQYYRVVIAFSTKQPKAIADVANQMQQGRIIDDD